MAWGRGVNFHNHSNLSQVSTVIFTTLPSLFFFLRRVCAMRAACALGFRPSYKPTNIDLQHERKWQNSTDTRRKRPLAPLPPIVGPDKRRTRSVAKAKELHPSRSFPCPTRRVGIFPRPATAVEVDKHSQVEASANLFHSSLANRCSSLFACRSYYNTHYAYFT